MKLKVQEIIAGVLLALAAVISIPKSVHYVQNLDSNLGYFSTVYIKNFSLFLQYSVTILLILTPLVAGIAALLLLLGKRKIAMIIAFVLLLIRPITIIFSLTWFKTTNDYGVSFFNLMKDLSLGRVDIWVDYDGRFFPRIFLYCITFILAAVSVVLLFLAKKANVGVDSSHELLGHSTIASQHPTTTQPPTSPLPYAMKKCPECAELIQGEAVKCRFCNYRYE